MGTIKIANKSTLTDRAATLLVGLYYARTNIEETELFMRDNLVRVKKKGHTFTVVDWEENSDEQQSQGNCNGKCKA